MPGFRKAVVDAICRRTRDRSAHRDPTDAVAGRSLSSNNCHQLTKFIGKEHPVRAEQDVVHESDLVIADGLAAEVSIDGMCGVY